MPKKLTDEQEQLMDSMGFKNQWIWALCFILLAVIIVGINVICRFADSGKLNSLEYTRGVVTGAQDQREWIGRRSRIRNSLSVEYTPEDSGRSYSWYDPDGSYEFFRKGDVLRVYYDEDDPEEAYPAKKDWLTGVYLRVDKSYNTALYIAIWPMLIGIFLFIDYQRAKKRALNGTLKPKKKIKSSVDPDYDPNLHEIVRMSGYKRSWMGFWICGTLFFLGTMFAGIMMIRAVITEHPKDTAGPVAAAVFFMLLGAGMMAGVIFSIFYVNGKKAAFIRGFMADEATAVYKDREKAAEILWRYVKHYMESEPPRSRFKLEYNRDWLESFDEHLEHLKYSKE